MTAELTWKQKALYTLVSDISEGCCCAGWMNGNEYALWHMLADPTADRHYGQSVVSENEITTMREISAEIGGWIGWVDDLSDPSAPFEEWGPQFIEMARWEGMFQDHQKVMNSRFYVMGQIHRED